MVSLIDSDTKIRDSKQFGKKYLTDNCVDTSWNSDQGASQWILIKFVEKIRLKRIKIQFQGGFSANELELVSNGENGQEAIELFELEDTNKEQEIYLKDTINCNQLTINLKNLTDQFGRVIVYKLDLLSDS